MKQLYLSFLTIALLAATFLQAQEKCGFAYTMQKARSRGFSDAAFEAEITRLIQQKVQNRLLFTGPVTVPVIFHVVYRNGDVEGAASSPNLAQAKVQAQLSQLNTDYANLSGSAYGVAANIQIQFCLAVVDPSGSPLAQAGVDRINGQALGWTNTNNIGSDVALINYFDNTIKPASFWDPYRYVNVWTADMDASGLLGYSTFPSLSTLGGLSSDEGETDQTAGVVIAAGSVGSVSSLGYAFPYDQGRTLTHELGHFFGLRHIWGDVTCGNDFCGDTPVQRDNTTGCPTVGGAQYLQNCPNNLDGTQRMFENYMDYSYDACLNTFTANQALRCQTVMDNSPRRVSLITSNACVPPVPNAISFLGNATSTSEAPTVLTCPRYKEVTVSLKAAVAASGNATVTFIKNGTALNITDYTVTPASVTFANGDNSTKAITIRIFDDGLVESSETLVLTYSISGSGVVAGTANQSHTVTIADNDITPSISNSGTIFLLNENFGTTGETLPAGWVAADFDGGSSTNVWVVSANGGAGVTGQAAHITNNTGTKPLQYSAGATSDVVLITPVINASAYSNLKLSFTYKCNGEQDAEGIYDYGLLMYSLNGSSFSPLLDGSNNPYIYQGVSAATVVSNLSLPTLLNNTTFYLGFAWFNDNSVRNNPPFLIDDVSVTVIPTQTEGTASQPVTENVFSGQDVYLKSSTDGQIIARIQTPNANIGCLTASLSQAGVTRVAVTTTSGSYFRTEKVIQITSAVANTTVTYQGTLYFSTAELAAWISAGVPLNTLKILKVKDGTSLGSTLNASNSEIVTPSSFSNQSAASGYYSYTANFTGFSQFMLVSPNIALPIELLSFEAKAVRRSIVLDWSTSQEINNSGFVIERSADGTNFERISWMAGKINSNTRSDYKYIDNYVQPGTLYHYRLRQTDIDLREKLSVVRQAKISGEGISLTINPNPAKDQVSLFISGSTLPAEVNLVNMQGQVVRKWKQVNASGAPVQLNIMGLAKGIYMLRVQLREEKLVEKLVIK
jgi:hypothetical protein